MKRQIKRFLNLAYKIRYLRTCRIDSNAWVRGRCVFEGCNRICENTFFISSEMGYGSYIGRNSNFTQVRIGKYCSIGGNVSVISGMHPINFVSTHPAFYSKNYGGISYVDENLADEITLTENGYRCEIGNDVWIGNNVLIRGGVKIGNGAVIGMGAVVTKDIPPYAVVGGVPAKIIKYRFDDQTISKLQKIAWWNYDDKSLALNAKLFKDVAAFIGEVCHENL